MDEHVAAPDEAARDVATVWLIRTDLPPDLLGHLESVLDEPERDRANRLTGERDRCRFIAVHGAVRIILARRAGLRPQDLAWRFGPNGKPELDPRGAPGRSPVQLNYSESGGAAMLAYADDRAVGVDVQKIPEPQIAARIAERFYQPADIRFVTTARPDLVADRFARLWSRKEACVKAHGGRLTQSLRLHVRAASGIVQDPSGALPGVCRLRDLAAPQGFRAAIALIGDAPYRIERHEWPSQKESLDVD